MSAQTHARLGEREPEDCLEQAGSIIDERIEQWRRARRALGAAQRLGATRRQPRCARDNGAESALRLLEYKSDRALEALGAAVSAWRALSILNRGYSATDAHDRVRKGTAR